MYSDHAYELRKGSVSKAEKVQHQKVLDFFWWGRTDSNHRSETQQIYSLSPLATRELPRIRLCLKDLVIIAWISDLSRGEMKKNGI